MSRKHAGGWEVVKLKYSGPQREEEESDLSEVEEDACSSSESEEDSVGGTLIDSDLEDYEGVAPQTAEGDGVREGQFGVGCRRRGLVRWGHQTLQMKARGWRCLRRVQGWHILSMLGKH